MTFSFNTALSGLNANSNQLNIVGNNIANSGTVGFRSSSATFADIFANRYGARLNGAGNSLQIGNGVRLGAVHTSFAQGGLAETGAPIQAAIQGNEFFVVRDAAGNSGYTRAGDFTIDNQGFVRSSSGGQVQGYQAQNGVIPQGAALAALQIPIGQTLAPQATAEATVRMNLNAGAAADSVFHAPVKVYDSRGGEHTMDMTFTRQADGSFQMTATVDGKAAQANGGASVNFVFDADGKLTAPTSLEITPDQAELNGASLPSITVNLHETNADGTVGAANITSYERASAVTATVQDGYAAGELNGVAVDQEGNIYGVFSNGMSRVVGQYAVATFNSNDGLSRAGDNMFSETLASGQANIGAPGTGGRGAVAGGYVEQSNVNITNEFVELIEAQRGFQANSRVITSLNQTFQDLLQII